MAEIKDILNLAEKRGAEKGLSYAGAVTPQEAYQILEADQSAILIDVRTKAELDLVGRVPVALHVEWATYPGMVANPDFTEQLQSLLDQRKVAKEAVLLFLCRTGARSHHAATVAEALGYHHALNILEGFEGEANSLKQRTLINGWKQAGLPWTN
ncbi:MAG: rhodanese-like domain-containing protein [Methylotenera sp.]|nr:rhodanese-like domain-containing protein [Methylotenera sp.]